MDKEVISRDEIAAEVRQDVVGKIASGLMQLAAGDGGQSALTAMATASAAATANSPLAAVSSAPVAVADGHSMAPWIDTEQCTGCDECTNLNPEIFAYNEDKKAFIQDPAAGPYKDIVKAAERCTARVIHPGLPRDRSAKDIDKWIKRGEKYN